MNRNMKRLTESDVRRIVREELDRANPVFGPPPTRQELPSLSAAQKKRLDGLIQQAAKQVTGRSQRKKP